MQLSLNRHCFCNSKPRDWPWNHRFISLVISGETPLLARERMGAILRLLPRISARDDYTPNYRLVGDYDLTAMIARMILEIWRNNYIGRVMLQTCVWIFPRLSDVKWRCRPWSPSLIQRRTSSTISLTKSIISKCRFIYNVTINVQVI